MTKFLKTFLVVFLALFSAFNAAYAQTTYASVSSGSWATAGTWETFPSGVAVGPSGSGTAATAAPSGSHNVYIRGGHTVSMGGSKNCYNLTIEANGTLLAGSTTAYNIRPGVGASGTNGNNVTVINNGTIGSATDGIYLELPVSADSILFTGTGTTWFQRIRIPGGNLSSPVLTINANINLTQVKNYALSAVYNPAATDNYTIIINKGATVKTIAADGYFHNSQSATTYGQYTYTIKGILDLSSNNQTTNNISANIIAPAPATSQITVNVDGGVLRTGTAFKADTSQSSPESTGVLALNLLNGGIVDASNASTFSFGQTSDGAGGFRNLIFTSDATSSIQQNVGATAVKFPVVLAGTTSNNSVTISNAGTADIFSVSVKGSIDNAPANPTQVVNRQWTITEGTPGGANATVSMSWVTADQGSGFSAAGAVVIARWTGTTYEMHTATVTGSGTIADPYVATASGFSAFSPFIVSNLTALPIGFESAKAYQKGNSVKVDWTTAYENNVDKFAVEKLTDGTNFTKLGTVSAAGNSSVKNEYSFLDATPVNGNNFYRINAIDKDGRQTYSSVLKVFISNAMTSVSIAPNPVRGRQLNIQFVNGVKAVYNLSLYNAGGQKVFSSKMNLEDGASTQTIILPASVKAGAYNLILNNGENKINKGIIVE